MLGWFDDSKRKRSSNSLNREPKPEHLALSTSLRTLSYTTRPCPVNDVTLLPSLAPIPAYRFLYAKKHKHKLKLKLKNYKYPPNQDSHRVSRNVNMRRLHRVNQAARFGILTLCPFVRIFSVSSSELCSVERFNVLFRDPSCLRTKPS